MLQTDIVWADPQKNRDKAAALMDSAPDACLYILPEMFSTGFCTSPDGIAEEEPSASLEWMKSQAAARKAAIAGSIAMHTGGLFRNRFCFIHPDGRTDFYDKRHLFSYGHEHREFTAGDSRVITVFNGMRILLQICYDLRFPVWSRNREDYDMAIYVANWPTARADAWKTLLKARAIENQCYVAGVNRVGTDPNCEYSGGTILVDPYGHTVKECPRGEQSAVTVELDKAMLESFREKFPVLDDADYFEMKNKE